VVSKPVVRLRGNYEPPRGVDRTTTSGVFWTTLLCNLQNVSMNSSTVCAPPLAGLLPSLGELATPIDQVGADFASRGNARCLVMIASYLWQHRFSKLPLTVAGHRHTKTYFIYRQDAPFPQTRLLTRSKIRRSSVSARRRLLPVLRRCVRASLSWQRGPKLQPIEAVSWLNARL
jgi:hypothetical protein